MLPGTNAQLEATFLKLNNSFSEIFGKPGDSPGREPDSPRCLFPRLGSPRQEPDRPGRG